MTIPVEKRESIDDVEFIPNQWYGIYLSESLKDKPVSLKRLAMNLVLWRNADSKVQCADAACPHRGADLGLGRVVGGQLECRYHGFCFNSVGACTRMPCEGSDAQIPPSMALTRYVVREEKGYIWLWYGDAEPAETLPWVPGAPDTVQGTCLRDFTWQARFSRVMEGMLDIHHLPFAHRPWLPGSLTRLDPYEVKAGNGMIRTRGKMRPDGEDRGKGMSLELSIAFPGMLYGQFTDHACGVATICPVDLEETWIGIRYHQTFVSIPVLAKLITWLALEFELKLIQPDDFLMLSSSRPRTSEPRRNHFVRADRGIAEWHRMRLAALGADNRNSGIFAVS